MQFGNGPRTSSEETTPPGLRERRVSARRREAQTTGPVAATSQPSAARRSIQATVSGPPSGHDGEDDKALIAIERNVPDERAYAGSWRYWCTGAAIVLGVSAGLYAADDLPMQSELQDAARVNANRMEEHSASADRLRDEIDRTREERERSEAAQAARPAAPEPDAIEPVTAEEPTLNGQAPRDERADRQAARDERRRAERAETSTAHEARTAAKKSAPAAAKRKSRSRSSRTADKNAASGADRSSASAGKGVLSGVLSDSNDPLMGL